MDGWALTPSPCLYLYTHTHTHATTEAVNFAPPDFLPWGGKAQELYRRLHRSPVFSQDQLVAAAAKVSSRSRSKASCH